MTVFPASLKGRLVTSLLALVIAGWLITGYKLWHDANKELDELLDGHLTQFAALLIAQESYEFEEEYDDEMHIDVPLNHPYAPNVAFQIYHKGIQTAHSTNAPKHPLPGQASQTELGFHTVEVDGVTWRVFGAYGKEQDILVYVGEQIRSREAILLAILDGMIWPASFTLPLMGMGIWWVIRRTLRPLDTLADRLQDRAPDALTSVHIEHVPSEMNPTLQALNALFQRISDLMESERRFTADAAHELRTPIAAIRTQAQVALIETNPSAQRHALQSTLEGCDRATRLIEQLLALSRLESSEQPSKTELDFTELVRRAIADIVPQTLLKGQSIEYESVATHPVMGDATLLSAMIRNLLDNACRYSPEGARIHVRLSRLDETMSLQIDDSGPGMNPDDLARIGERFFRAIGSGQSGSGLGWSIAKRIAQVHLGSLQATQSTLLGGLCVTFEWPQAQSSSSS